MGIATDLLWDFLEGKCGKDEFARFQQSFSDSALEILTGDDGGLNEDPESDAFSNKIFYPLENFVLQRVPLLPVHRAGGCCL